VAPADCVFLNAKLEADLAELDDEEARELLESVGVTEPGLDQLAHVGFHTLGLQTYLTAGPKESRAWTIRQGWTAPQAAGVIHTDFQRGFIKAEIVSFADLDAAGSMAAAARRRARCGWRARTTSWPTATWSSSGSTSRAPGCVNAGRPSASR
jgi:ribosome-binding ATPase YchF (GTP1/OBG family)